MDQIMEGSIPRLYNALPGLRNVAATMKGMLMNHQRYGPEYRTALKGILDRDAWSQDRLSQYQTDALLQRVKTAALHVPYYRTLFQEYGLSPNDFRSLDDMTKLPILEKHAVRSQQMNFLDERMHAPSLLRENTTGTTGIPLAVFKSRAAEQTNYAFFEARCRRVAGLHYGDDAYVMFGCKQVVPVARGVPPFWCYNYAAKQLYMSVFHLAPQYLSWYCRELRRRKYKAMMGYPSAMAILARYILDEGITDIAIPIAITNGETLTPDERAVIEAAFNSHVYNQFGCTELSVFAAECDHARLHVSIDYGMIEVVDDAGNRRPKGKIGHLVCTGLINDAQILLRYKIGDLGAFDTTPCICGSPLPVLKTLYGRQASNIILNDGRIIPELGTFAEYVPGVIECQVVQEEVDRFCIYVVASKQFTRPHRERMIANLASSVGRAQIRVEHVTNIERGPGGKYQFIVSKVVRPARLIQAI